MPRLAPESLRVAVRLRGWSSHDLHARLGGLALELLEGRCALTPAVLDRLAAAFGTSREFWTAPLDAAA